MSHVMPRCQRCGTMIAPEEAVPYLDKYGQPIPGQYRNWCIFHWANRLGALPPSHPDFYKPIDPRTRRKDNIRLGRTPAPHAIHGREVILEHMHQRAQAVQQQNESSPLPPRPDITAYLARAQGFVSLFPKFEEVGAWLLRNAADLKEE